MLKETQTVTLMKTPIVKIINEMENAMKALDALILDNEEKV